MRELALILMLCSSWALAEQLPTPPSPQLPPLQDLPEQRVEVQHQLAAHALQRKEIVAANMQLSEAEAEVFWPLYYDYRDRVNRLTDDGLRSTVEYAQSVEKGGVGEQDAERWMNQILERESLRQALRKSYLLKMEQALSARIAMRFMQIDGQLDARLRADLLRQIPLKM